EAQGGYCCLTLCAAPIRGTSRGRGRAATAADPPWAGRRLLLHRPAVGAQTLGRPGERQITRWHDTPPPDQRLVRAGASSGNTVDEQASTPDTTPPQGSLRWPAVLRAGRAFSRQIRLR